MLKYQLKHPQKKHRDWLEKIKAEGLTKRAPVKEETEEKDPSAPQVLPEAAWLWRLFGTLNAQRPNGSNNAPIPLAISEVYALSEIEELDKAETRWFLEVVMKLDRVYLEDAYQKIAKEQEKRNKGKAKAGHQRRRG